MWSYVSDEEPIPQDHSLRAISAMGSAILKEILPRFTPLYSQFGGPSIPPERLHRAPLLRAFCSIRSERLSVEQLNYNICFGSASVLIWTSRFGTRRLLRRIVIDCLKVISPDCFSTVS